MTFTRNEKKIGQLVQML